MLNVSAANPELYNRVGALARCLDLRTWLTRALAQSAARSKVLAAAGRRRYLLEEVDSFAMVDLLDVANGPFSKTLPWLERAWAMVERAKERAQQSPAPAQAPH